MKPIYIFYILVFYILLQFVWWSYLLVDMNREVFEHRIENIHLRNSDPAIAAQEEEMLHHKQHQRLWMIVGEGSVFLMLLSLGLIQTLRAFRKESELARMQKNFLLSITHEFKSPLASIKLYLQTLQKHDLDKEKRNSFITSAIADTERLDALVENTLVANMVDHKGYVFTKEELNLSALIRLLVQKFNTLPGSKQRIEAKIEESLTMSVDKLPFSLMINNLLENAIRYSPADSPVTVELKREKEKIIFSVSDKGIGIPAKEKEKVFQKFYRIGNEETRSTKGTGLGLYIAQHIAQNHNGKITIRDNHPKGTTFEITFSLA